MLPLLELLGDTPSDAVQVDTVDPSMLLKARLLPQFAWLYSLGTGAPRHPRLEGLLYVVLEAQRVLHQVGSRIVHDAAAAGLFVSPIKGFDSLLWGAGTFGRTHTRDIDVLTNRQCAEQFQQLLWQRGFRQLKEIDPATGLTTEVSGAELDAFEDNQIQVWPWKRLVDAPQLAPYVRTIAQAGSALDPVILIANRPAVVCSVDLHHAVWPGVGAEDLQHHRDAVGEVQCSRLSPVDNIITSGGKAVAEFAKGRLSPVGSLFQTAWLARRLQIPAPLLEQRAASFGIQTEAAAFVSLVEAIRHRDDTGDNRPLCVWADQYPQVISGEEFQSCRLVS